MKQCPQQTFSDSSGWRCQLCHSSCQSCHGPRSTDCDICLVWFLSVHMHLCITGLFLDQDSSCVAQCPSGSYANSATQLCEDCSPNCESCVDTSDTCIKLCIDGTRLFPLHTAEGSCEACDSSCLTCDEVKSHFLYLMLNGVCKASCPMGYYEDMEEGRCGQCHPTCGSCSGPLADDCETCSTFNLNIFLYFPDSTCVSECPDGTYSTRQEADGKELGFCLPCDHVCSTCTGASPRDCLTCSPGYLRLLQLCVTHCPTGYKAPSQSPKCVVCVDTQSLLMSC
uniref:Growth factor receptor domain-containing protein n=1 Tax=Stegastes partitus TaxID=144197 RepID=A0A3B5AP22_9TELE